MIQAALSTGETIECECYIPTGSKGGTGGAFMPADAVDEKGYIKVGPTLQVQVVFCFFLSFQTADQVFILQSMIRFFLFYVESSDDIRFWRLVIDTLFAAFFYLN